MGARAGMATLVVLCLACGNTGSLRSLEAPTTTTLPPPPTDAELLAASGVCEDVECTIVLRADKVATAEGPATVAVVHPTGGSNNPAVPVAAIVAPAGRKASTLAVGELRGPVAEAYGPDGGGRVVIGLFSGGAHCCLDVFVIDVTSGVPTALFPGSVARSEPGFDAEDRNGDGLLDLNVATNPCLLSCAGGPFGAELWQATASGYTIVACEWESPGTGAGYSVAPLDGTCPAPDMARICGSLTYDPTRLACVEPTR